MLDKFCVLAHRGVSSVYPENTMEAFKEAYRVRMDGVELDVQLSKDGELVVIHDEKVDRTSNGTGYVVDHTLAELQTLDVGSFFHEKYRGCRIPVLDEVLSFFQGKNMIVNIELKTSEFKYPGLEEKVIECIKRYELEEYILITSFNHLTIKRFQEAMKKISKEKPRKKTVGSIDSIKNIESGILLENVQFDIVKYVNDYNIKYINPSREYLNMERESFMKLKEQGKVITPYTIDSIEEMKDLKKLGISVITNLPISKEQI